MSGWTNWNTSLQKMDEWMDGFQRTAVKERKYRKKKCVGEIMKRKRISRIL